MVLSFIDYQKLEKVEVGGLTGRWYSQIIDDINLRFSKFIETMSSISYDPLDLYNTSFVEDYNTFLEMSDDFDRRLAKVSKTCFEESNNLMSLHKVNTVFIISN